MYLSFSHTPLEQAVAGAGGLRMKDVFYPEWKFPELR